MSLSEKLIHISQKFNLTDDELVKLEKFLNRLRKQDIITASLLSRIVGINYEKAEDLLPELVNLDILTYFIIVSCQNPDIEDGALEHYQRFDSLSEFNKFTSTKPCPVCDCGFDFELDKNVRVGFKLNWSSQH